MKDYMDLLGLPVKDCVTGLKGVVTGISFDLYGCVQAAVTPAAEGTKLEASRFLDAKRLSTTGRTPKVSAPTFHLKTQLAPLGMAASDKVSGFKGVVTSVYFDVRGTVDCIVTPTAGDDGKVGDSHWFPPSRLAIAGTTPVMAPPSFEILPAGAERGPAEKPAFARPI